MSKEKRRPACAHVWGCLLPWDAAVLINTSLQRSTHPVCWAMFRQLCTLTTVREWVPRSYERLGEAFDREKWFAKPYAFALFFQHPLLNVGLFVFGFFFS